MNKLRTLGAGAALVFATGCGPEAVPPELPSPQAETTQDAYYPQPAYETTCTRDRRDDPEYDKQVADYCAVSLQGKLAVINMFTSDQYTLNEVVDSTIRILNQTSAGRIALQPIVMSPGPEETQKLITRGKDNEPCVDIRRQLVAKQVTKLQPLIDGYPFVLAITDKKPCASSSEKKDRPAGLSTYKYADVYAGTIPPIIEVPKPSRPDTQRIAATAAHEIGHSMTVGHASTVECKNAWNEHVITTPSPNTHFSTDSLAKPDCDFDTYGDMMDVMGHLKDTRHVWPSTLFIDSLAAATSTSGKSPLGKTVTSGATVAIDLQQSLAHEHIKIPGEITVTDLDPGGEGSEPEAQTFEGLAIVALPTIKGHRTIASADVYLYGTNGYALAAHLVGYGYGKDITITHAGNSYKVAFTKGVLEVTATN